MMYLAPPTASLRPHSHWPRLPLPTTRRPRMNRRQPASCALPSRSARRHRGSMCSRPTAPGKYRGVTIDLSSALAKKLGVEIEWVPYAGSGEIQAAAATGVWDVAYMPVDERKKFVDFGTPYHLLQSTYLVAPTATSIQKVEDASKAGVRVAGVTDTATFRASNRASPNATHISLKGPDDAVALMLEGKADAIALGRASLGGVRAKIQARGSSTVAS